MPRFRIQTNDIRKFDVTADSLIEAIAKVQFVYPIVDHCDRDYQTEKQTEGYTGTIPHAQTTVLK